MVGRKKLKEDCQSPVHLLHSKLKVLHSLMEFEDQVMQDSEIFARRIKGWRLLFMLWLTTGRHPSG